MSNIVKYTIMGVIAILIILFGLSVITNDVTKNTEGNFIDKIINIGGDNSNNISETTGTVYQYGNSKITYAKSNSVEPFIAEIKNRSDLQQIDIGNAPNNSTAFKTSDGQYALLIVKSDDSEAVLIKSPTQKELIEAARKINTGEEILSQIINELNNVKINTSQINLDNLQI